jgi:hypothetical protein
MVLLLRKHEQEPCIASDMDTRSYILGKYYSYIYGLNHVIHRDERGLTTLQTNSLYTIKKDPCLRAGDNKKERK